MANDKQELAILVSARDLASKTIGKVNKSLSSIGGHARRGVATAAKNLVKLGTIAAGVGVGLGALSIRVAAGFDQAMTESLAIVDGVTPKIRKRMEDTARAVARSTTFSASEAAEAYFFLASAGLTAEQQISALPRVAKFAQAGNFDLATATDLLTDAQSALGLAFKDTTRNEKELVKLSDQLVKSNALSNASVEEFSAALTSKAGAAMRKFGIETADGLALLAVFAKNGTKGEKAGNTFASMLAGLTNAATKNRKAFEKHNIEIFDANGELLPMVDITRNLTRAFGDMTDEQRASAFQQLGINRLTASGVDLLLGEAKVMGGFRKELRSAGDTTEKVANEQLTSFSSQLAILRSNLEDIGIALGSALLPGLKRVTSKFSEFLGSKKGRKAVEGFATRLGEAFDDAITSGEAFLTGLDWDAIKENLGRIGGAFGDLGAELGPSVIEALKNMPWTLIGESATLLATGVKKAFELFDDAPDWLKTAVITGWGLNKLTGGAFGSIVSELGKGLVKGVLGIKAGVVNVTGATVRSGGLGGAPAGARGSIMPIGLGGVFLVALAAASVTALGIEFANAIKPLQEATDEAIAEARGNPAAEAGPGIVNIAAEIRRGFETGNLITDFTNKVQAGLFGQTQIDQAFLTLARNLLTDQQANHQDLAAGLEAIEALQQLDADHGVLTAKAADEIKKIEQGVRDRLGAIRANTQGVTGAVRDVRTTVAEQDLSVSVTTNVTSQISARDVAHEQTKTQTRTRHF